MAETGLDGLRSALRGTARACREARRRRKAAERDLTTGRGSRESVAEARKGLAEVVAAMTALCAFRAQLRGRTHWNGQAVLSESYMAVFRQKFHLE